MGGVVLGSITVRGVAVDVGAARRFVAEALRGRPEVDTAVLLTSEAVTNSVIHTDSARVTVVVIETPDGLRVEVSDEGGDSYPSAYRGCDLREDRRGVFLVQELSRRSGFHSDENGLTYWFEL